MSVPQYIYCIKPLYGLLLRMWSNFFFREKTNTVSRNSIFAQNRSTLPGHVRYPFVFLARPAAHRALVCECSSTPADTSPRFTRLHTHATSFRTTVHHLPFSLSASLPAVPEPQRHRQPAGGCPPGQRTRDALMCSCAHARGPRLRADSRARALSRLQKMHMAGLVGDQGKPIGKGFYY